MSALDPVPPAQLAELLMSAAAQLTDAAPSRAALAPMGIPVRGGRLHLGRTREMLAVDEPLVVAAGFATACWLGPPAGRSPNLGRLAYRSVARVDDRGRVVLDRRVRSWLAVDNPACFEVVAIPALEGGLLVVPIEDSRAAGR